MLGGFKPDGSKTTLDPNTILDGLAAKNFEMDHVQLYSMASFAATLSFWSRSSIEVPWIYMSSTCLRRCLPSPE